MKRCSAKPYEGNKPYIFVSYCHQDRAEVFPVIEQLARDGYRIWYDEGIDPGSEWPEIIAGHLDGCAVCIAFISGKSLESHNCRREINFALLKRKPFISVVIEEAEMSLGMQMQLSATQSIFRYMIGSDYEFFQKLFEAKFLEQCKGEPDSSVVVSKPGDYREVDMGMFTEHTSSVTEKTFSDQWFIGEKQKPVKAKLAVETDSVPVQPEAKEETISEPAVNTPKSVILVYEKTGEQIQITEGELKMGRSSVKSDYVIQGNSGIGRLHAKIVRRGDECFVVDCNSLNKTYLNGKMLEPEQEYALADGDMVRLLNEDFTLHIR